MVTALTAYLNSNASSTLSTAGTIGTVIGGSNSTRQSLIGTSTGYGELWALSNAGAWAAGASLAAPSGHGWLWDVTTLEKNQLNAGNWTPTMRFQLSAGTATADVYVRAYKRSSGGVYTLIGTFLKSGINWTTTLTAATWSATSVSVMTFGTGDKLYLECQPNITANSTGSGAAVIKYTVDTTAGDGNTNAQVVTPGYQLTTTTDDTSARFLLSAQATKDLVSRFLQSATVAKNLGARFGLQVGKNLSGRFLQSAQVAKDLTVRFRVGKPLDLSARFKLLQQVTRDLRSRLPLGKPLDFTTRFLLDAIDSVHNLAGRFSLGKALDQVTRFRQSALVTDSLLARFRIGKPLDQTARFKLSQLVTKDTFSRLRVDALVLKNIAARLALQSAAILRDVPTRFPLSVTKAANLSTRFLLDAVDSAHNLGTRFPLSAIKVTNLAARFALSVTEAANLTTRFRLNALGLVRNLPARFPLQAFTSHDQASRFRQASVAQLRSLLTRLSLIAIVSKEITLRLKLASAPRPIDTQARFRQYVLRVFDSALRFALDARHTGDTASRLALLAYQWHPLSGRFALRPDPAEGAIFFPLPAPTLSLH